MLKKKFVILSGPACVGKGPLISALNRFYPDLHYTQIPVIKSIESRPKGPRPEEENIWNDPDYFRLKEALYNLESNPQFLVGDCRGLPQAVDLSKIKDSNETLFFIEIYYTLGAKLIESKFLENVDIKTIFLSPVSKQEIIDLRLANVEIKSFITQLMFCKQLMRARFQRKEIDNAFIIDAKNRAADAIKELRIGCKYAHVIVNHDGEGNPNWHRLPNGVFISSPEGDASRSLNDLLNLVAYSLTERVENWNSLNTIFDE